MSVRARSFRPYQPLWARSLNIVGAALGKVGATPYAFEWETLIREARRRTGLHDLGADDYRAPLAVYLSALEHEARLSLLGRWLIREDILNLLETRLRITDLEKQRPEIFERDIVAPIFITGAARSGTSILHRLLGQDPANRIPLIWEALFPCPPDSGEAERKDNRFARADRLMRIWTAIVPDLRKIHDVRGDLPSECGMLMSGSGASDQQAVSVQAPSYGALIFGPDADLTKSYEWHKKVLQILQWQRPGRWILKAPSHMRHIRTVFAVYPDARIIQTHRDPLKTLPSTVSLINALAWIRSDHVDYEAIRAGLSAEGMALSLEAMRAFREESGIDSSRFHDVVYADLVRDPLGVIEKTYAHFDMPLEAEARKAIAAMARQAPKDTHGKHDYSYAAEGWDMTAMRATFADYQRHYGVPSEL